MNNTENQEDQEHLYKTISKVTAKDASAYKISEANFKFRSVLNEKKAKALKKNAPAVALRMLNNYNSIIEFGEPVLFKLNTTSAHVLETQTQMRVPSINTIKDLLEDLDTFSEKHSKNNSSSFASKITSLFSSSGNPKSMQKEINLIAAKLNISAGAIQIMEQELGENITRGQLLYQDTINTLQEVVSVLAALEEILEVLKTDLNKINKIVELNTETNTLKTVVWQNETITLNQLLETQTTYAMGVNEIEKTWLDWRQQFFLGFAQAPAIQNLISISVNMKRRYYQFRNMAIPSARSSLIMWQQAAIANDAAEMSNTFAMLANKTVKSSYENSAKIVDRISKAKEIPITSEETILTIAESIKSQCEALTSSVKDSQLKSDSTAISLSLNANAKHEDRIENRSSLVEAAIEGSNKDGIHEEIETDEDIMKSLGIF